MWKDALWLTPTFRKNAGGLHGAIIQKIVLFAVTAVRTSYPIVLRNVHIELHFLFLSIGATVDSG
jgi:hypothetical protein